MKGSLHRTARPPAAFAVAIIAKGERIRDVRRLVRTYGGKPAGWVKKASPSFAMAGRWYDRGIGRVVLKRTLVEAP